jgi:hypothetical protein
MYTKDPALLLEESMTKGAKKEPIHVQTRLKISMGLFNFLG